MQLHWKMIIGLILGTIYGIASAVNGWSDFTSDFISPFGTIFLNLLKLIAVPLVVSSLITGVASLSDTTKLSRIGWKTIALYISTTAVAVSIGLILVNVLQPGSLVPDNFQETLSEEYRNTAATKQDLASSVQNNRGPLQPLVDMVPSNMFSAASNNSNMLQIVFISIIFGIALIGIDRKFSQPVLAFLEGINQMIIKLVEMIMYFAPYGVFALIAKTISSVSGDVSQIGSILSALLFYMGVVVLGLFIHMGITYLTILKMFTNMDLKHFFKSMAPVQLLAFSTSSSGATLPVTMKRCEKDLGVSEEISSFVLPLGATINMDGTAIMQGCATYFLAAYYGIDLVLSDFILIILTATVASIGTAGIPSAGIIMLSLILTELGIPLEGITLLLGVDRLLDMMRTSVNVSGDTCISCIVAQSEKLIDTNKYNQ